MDFYQPIFFLFVIGYLGLYVVMQFEKNICVFYPINSLLSSCLGSTCYAQTPFARYWRAIKAAADETTPKVIAQTPKVIKLMYKNKIWEN